MADSYIVLEFQLNVNTGAAQKLEGAVFYFCIYFSYMLYFFHICRDLSIVGQRNSLSCLSRYFVLSTSREPRKVTILCDRECYSFPGECEFIKRV